MGAGLCRTATAGILPNCDTRSITDMDECAVACVAAGDCAGIAFGTGGCDMYFYTDPGQCPDYPHMEDWTSASGTGDVTQGSGSTTAASRTCYILSSGIDNFTMEDYISNGQQRRKITNVTPNKRKIVKTIITQLRKSIQNHSTSLQMERCEERVS